MIEVKYIVLLGDGMADWPLDELGGKTPLQVAHKPNMDTLAKRSLMGMVKTVPDGMPAGSDVANLSVFGFNPREVYTGRSPLEAVSMGIRLSDDDIALRCNLVTLSDTAAYQDATMLDYSAGEITTEEASELIQAIAQALNREGLSFYPGVSYRHCLVWNKGPLDLELTPPHDISGKPIREYLPKGKGGEVLLDLMVKSRDILKNHPVNIRRMKKGLNPATSIWLWGQGKRPAIPLFIEKYGLCGAVISAVDLIRGIGKASGMHTVEVPGATGNIHTNFKGKAMAALDELKSGRDLVYIHVEAPDECGHQGLVQEKIRSIELIDREVLGTLLDGLEGSGDYSILILPDHPTPIAIRTHCSDPVPFMIYRSGNPVVDENAVYTEAYASGKDLLIEKGYTLMDMFLGNR